MTWLGPALLGMAMLLILWRMRMPPLWIGAIFLTGAAAYAFAGSFDLPSSTPANAEAQTTADSASAVEAARLALAGDPANVALWAQFSGALIADGRSEEAIEGLSFAASQLPPSADLQVQLGTALMAHADGMMTPAAQLAFTRAQIIQPDHPAPLYFRGLSALQAANPSAALGYFRDLEARTPPGAPWAEDLQRKIRGAEAMMAAGVGG